MMLTADDDSIVGRGNALEEICVVLLDGLSADRYSFTDVPPVFLIMNSSEVKRNLLKASASLALIADCSAARLHLDTFDSSLSTCERYSEQTQYHQRLQQQLSSLPRARSLPCSSCSTLRSYRIPSASGASL